MSPRESCSGGPGGEDAAGKMPLGAYLAQRLYEQGCKDCFTVAGDFVLGLLNHFVDSKVNLVCCCNELNAAYASDGYARLQGLGAVITTHAVGELSAINGIAGAFSESVPVVMIVGVPARKHYIDQPLLHHTLGDYHAPMKMYSHVTVAQTLLTDPETAAAEIDRVLTTCLLLKKPVYIGVPSDMVPLMISPAPKLVIQPPISNEAAVLEAAEEIAQRIRDARRPLFIPGVEIIRRNLNERFQVLTEKSGVPYVTMLLSKGLLSESHKHFIGLYSGQRSRSDVVDAVTESDCIIFIGEKLTDFNTGGFTVPMEPSKRILIAYDRATVKMHTYNDVYINDLLEKLIALVEPQALRYEIPVASLKCVHRRDNVLKYPKEKELSMNSFFSRMAKNIPENAVVVAETGSSLFSCSEMMLPDSVKFIGQTFYGSIGYSVGSTLGACVAAERARTDGDVSRDVFLFVGDGSFQLTAQDVSTMIRYNHRPIIWLINNDGYTIERVITDNVYNDIQMWRYANLPAIFGGRDGYKITTHGDLDNVFANELPKRHSLALVEIILDKWDCNNLLKETGRVMAINNSLPPNDMQAIHRVDSSQFIAGMVAKP